MMMDNCYLELTSFPTHQPLLVQGQCPLQLQLQRTQLGQLGLQLQPQSPGTYSLSPSCPSTASYYTDLELKNCKEIR